jgi:hypothetical protein
LTQPHWRCCIPALLLLLLLARLQCVVPLQGKQLLHLKRLCCCLLQLDVPL